MQTVIVVHGLWLPGFETWLLRDRLGSAGFTPVLFRFPTVHATLSENVALLAGFAREQPGDTLHFVGHSLGGVLAVALFQRQQPARSGRIVCLGSPLNGSEAGRALSRLGFGGMLVGRSVGELNEQGGLPPWSGTADLGVIAGSLGFGFGHLLGPLARPHDGTVAVDETMLEGVTDHIVLPVTHTSMVFDRRVADATIAFLRSGRFPAPAGSGTQ